MQKASFEPPDEIPPDRLINVENNGKEDVSLFLKKLVDKIYMR